MIFPPMQHPDRYVWDFWYYFDAATRLFHVFYLNADQDLVATKAHHFSACVGHATTPDFIQMNWGDANHCSVLKSSPDHWANTCIWSGDILKIKNGFLLFYTSRDSTQDDGMTQNIGVAYSATIDSDQWQLTALRIRPDHSYQRKSLPGDRTIHAWRDPFLFQAKGQVYMLVSAKAIDDPIGRNGTIGLLRLNNNDFLQGQWDYLDPLAKPCCYSEMEVPQLYQNSQGDYELVFSSWAEHDFSVATEPSGGLHGFTSSNFRQFSQPSHVWLPERNGLYACRVIPELDGEIVGFDIQTGGIRRSGVLTDLRHVDRDFSNFSVRLGSGST